MAILEILQYPAKSLLIPSEPVITIDDKIISLIKDMGETMFAAPGVGLAAPQVGVNQRIIVYDTRADIPKDSEDETETPVKDFKGLINPVIVEKTGSIISENEACLSVPELTSNVKRYEKVRINALDIEGEQLEFDVEGVFAIIMQHEIDHLDGILFFERISLLKRKMYKKRIAKKESEK